MYASSELITRIKLLIHDMNAFVSCQDWFTMIKLRGERIFLLLECLTPCKSHVPFGKKKFLFQNNMWVNKLTSSSWQTASFSLN